MPVPKQLVQRILPWFAQNARDLPWRKTTDPYAIWISEVMLQQTQVRTVIPYWERWMKVFPDTATLAQASLDQVLKLWEGLGYYRRAKNLHAGAQLLRQSSHADFPRDYETLLAMPGIGRYTAGAICSIAFDQPFPVLDGNVTRVLSRIFGISESVRSKHVIHRLWELARELVEAAAVLDSGVARPCSSLNQGLMELGATVCAPQNPACYKCPVSMICDARRTASVSRIPDLEKRPKPTARSFVAFIATRRGRVLVRQRPEGLVNGRLWELPNLELKGPSGRLKELARLCLGFPVGRLEKVGTVRHSITRYRIELSAYRVMEHRTKMPVTTPGRWCGSDELDELAFASAHRKILTLLQGGSRGPRPNGGSHSHVRTIRNRFQQECGPTQKSS